MVDRLWNCCRSATADKLRDVRGGLNGPIKITGLDQLDDEVSDRCQQG